MVSIINFKEFYQEESGWTKAFEAAIRYLRQENGGMLYVPVGKYETCSIQLYDNINLYLEAGAELLFIQDYEKYQVVDAEFEGKCSKMYMPFIYARDAVNVCISGNGTINGQGDYWWKRIAALECARPYLVYFVNCRRVKVLDVEFLNSPAWTIHPQYCEDVEIKGITIRNPADSPNTDGINPDSSRNVRVADCLIDVGDDCITLKAGTEETPCKIPCENITITNCNMIHGHGGVVVGSEMSGMVRNVAITNCVFQDTDRGVRVKTRRGRGGIMEDIVISNLIMERVLCPFTFNMFYQCGAKGVKYKEKVSHAVSVETPVIRNIQIQNVLVKEARAAAGFFYGLPEMPIEDIFISDCRIFMAEDAEVGMPAMLEDIQPMRGKGIYMRFAEGVTLRNIRIYGFQGEAVDRDGTVTGTFDTDYKLGDQRNESTTNG